MSIFQNTLPRNSPPYSKTQSVWWEHLLWVLGAAVLGWICTSVFAGLLHWSRPLFLTPYVLLTGGFLVAWAQWNRFDLRQQLGRHWYWGVLAALLVGTFVVQSVLRQPKTPMPQGSELVFDLLWLGLIYGLIDALFLTVLPIASTWQAFSHLGWTEHWPGRIATGVLALLASLLVTATYHLGYPEFQGVTVFAPLLGVGVMSVAYLLSRNPLAPMLSHIAMHVAAVLYGLATAVQLPPHY